MKELEEENRRLAEVAESKPSIVTQMGTQRIATKWRRYGGKLLPTLPRWLIDGTRPSRLAWLLKEKILPPVYWQAMLKGDAGLCDLEQARVSLLAECAGEISDLQDQFGLQAITVLEGQHQTLINYPVLEYPTKVKSFNLDKTPEVGGTLLGIKGQYLIFDTGVINMRKYGGYQLSLLKD